MCCLIPRIPAFGGETGRSKVVGPDMKVHNFNPALHQLVLVRISAAAKKT